MNSLIVKNKIFIYDRDFETDSSTSIKIKIYLSLREKAPSQNYIFNESTLAQIHNMLAIINVILNIDKINTKR
jgi:hypothetical protein